MGDRAVWRALVAGLILFIAGIFRDVQWHATHDTQRQFETASKQIEVHWLLWLGMAVLLVAGWLALRRTSDRLAARGYRLLLASGLVYAVVSVWHFIEHANGSDPQVAHGFLYAASVGTVVGASLGLFGSQVSSSARPA